MGGISGVGMGVLWNVCFSLPRIVDFSFRDLLCSLKWNFSSSFYRFISWLIRSPSFIFIA